MNILVGWLLIGVAIALYLTGLLAALRRRCDAAPRFATRLMLIFLRLAIGWHFFIEGVDKLGNPTWTSAAYLRESTGPLAPRFRALAGDPVVDMLRVPDDKTLSPALDQEWQNYQNAVVSFYHLDDAQAGKLAEAIKALKQQTAQLLANGKKTVETISPYPPSLKLAKTIKERIEVLHHLQDRVAEIEAGPLPQFPGESAEAWKTAKADLNRWRGELKKDLDMVNKDLKRTVRQTLLEFAKLPEPARKKVDDAVKKQRQLSDTDLYGANAKVFDKVKLEPGRSYVIDMESPDIDCCLRLENGSGIKLAEDLGSGRKASIKYTVPPSKTAAKDRTPPDSKSKVVSKLEKLAADDPEFKNDPDIFAAVDYLSNRPRSTTIPESYRIVAGSFGKQTGNFTLICKEAPAKKDGKAEKNEAKVEKAEKKNEQPASSPTRLTREMLLWEMACLSMPNNLGVGPFPLLLTTLEFPLTFTVDTSSSLQKQLGVKAGEFPTVLTARWHQSTAPAAADKGGPPSEKFAIGKLVNDKIKDPDPLRTPTKADDWDSIDRIKEKLDDKIADEYRKTVDPRSTDPLTQLVLDNILAKRKKEQPNDPLPFTVARQWRQWTLLDWSDHIVKYGIAAVGVMLLVGLFTRLACLAGAGFLLMFFLAMPPLPGWPESPRSEGHYLYVNKNTIEMLALLVLATTWSGRWLGLDGLVQFFNPWRWRKRIDEGNMK